MRNSCTESFTWKGMAWFVLEARLSLLSSWKLLAVVREPEMLKAAPARGEAGSTSWTPGRKRPRARKLRLKSGIWLNCVRVMLALREIFRSFWMAVDFGCNGIGGGFAAATGGGAGLFGVGTVGATTGAVGFGGGGANAGAMSIGGSVVCACPTFRSKGSETASTLPFASRTWMTYPACGGTTGNSKFPSSSVFVV